MGTEEERVEGKRRNKRRGLEVQGGKERGINEGPNHSERLEVITPELN